MNAEELMKKYAMEEHPENGAFAERHYVQEGPGRADSGSIYYFVGPEERTGFHRIDCDEYWCYVAGAPLEVWMIDENGGLRTERLGADADSDPHVYVRRGVIFASKHAKGETAGTFLICITVPRFSYDGFELFSQEEMLAAYPFLAEFYNEE